MIGIWLAMTVTCHVGGLWCTQRHIISPDQLTCAAAVKQYGQTGICYPSPSQEWLDGMCGSHSSLPGNFPDNPPCEPLPKNFVWPDRGGKYLPQQNN